MKEQYKTLELHKILEMLSQLCSNDASSKAALEIEPSTDIDEVRREVKKTFDALSVSVRFGSPNFINFPDVAVTARRAQSGSELSLKELLDVSKLLSQTQSLKSWRKQFSDESFSLDYLFEALFDNKWLYDKIINSVASEDELLILPVRSLRQ